jgi:hypothetical protein
MGFQSRVWDLRRWWISLTKGVSTTSLFDWGSTSLTRTSIINRLLALNQYRRYLEIGCQSDRNFKAVPAAEKTGVDPATGGTHRMTSDRFFAENKGAIFDLVFIDGLHTYEQVRKDVVNSLKALAVGGVLVLHDMLPGSWEQERVPRLNQIWNGTVWKIAYELKRAFGDKFGIIVADQGVGVVFKDADTNLHRISTEESKRLENKAFEDFRADHQGFNLVSPEDAERFLTRRAYTSRSS